MNNISIPIFTSDASLGRSILTSDDFEIIEKKGTKKPKEIDENSTSIWTIANIHNLNPVHIVENSMVSFISHFKYAKKSARKLIFGVKFKLLQDATEKTESSFNTESEVIVWMKNSSGYDDLIRLYSAIHSEPNNFYYYARGDWKILNRYWTKNLVLTIPFYNSFLEKNTFTYGHRAIPEFGQIEPNFLLEYHDLPFDNILSDVVKKYALSHKYQLTPSHSIYYYANKDAIAYQNLRCILDRTTFDMPNLKHFSSDKFSFESWLKMEEEKSK